MNVRWGHEKKVDYTESKILHGCGEYIHMFKECYGEEHHEPCKLRNQEKFYDVGN